MSLHLRKGTAVSLMLLNSQYSYPNFEKAHRNEINKNLFPFIQEEADLISMRMTDIMGNLSKPLLIPLSPSQRLPSTPDWCVCLLFEMGWRQDMCVHSVLDWPPYKTLLRDIRGGCLRHPWTSN